jgi:hypothetical protein
MDPQGVGSRDMEWIDLAQDMDRWRALVMRLWTSGPINLWEILY